MEGNLLAKVTRASGEVSEANGGGGFTDDFFFLLASSGTN